MNTSPRPYVLAEINWKTVREQKYTVAILPWGATEAHNYHLPYGTDNILAENAAIEAAKKAWSKEAKVIVLPNIPFGVNTGQMDVDLCINMNPSTQMALLKDVVQVLEVNKIRKLVFKIKGLKEGWVSAQRKWTQVTKDTGVGNPKMASPENGANYFRAVTDGIAEFLIDLHEVDVDDMYE